MKTARPDQKKPWCAGGYKNTLRVLECGVKLAKRRFCAGGHWILRFTIQTFGAPQTGLPFVPLLLKRFNSVRSLSRFWHPGLRGAAPLPGYPEVSTSFRRSGYCLATLLVACPKGASEVQAKAWQRANRSGGFGPNAALLFYPSQQSWKRYSGRIRKQEMRLARQRGLLRIDLHECGSVI